MNKLEYLRRCVTALKPLERKSWYIQVLAILFPGNKPDPQDPSFREKNHPLNLVSTHEGLYVVVEDQDGVWTLELIEDAKKDQALFTIKDSIEIDDSWGAFARGKRTTRLGNLFLNAGAFYPAVQNRMPYLEGPITADQIEGILSKKIRSTGAELSGSDVSTKEYVELMDRLNFFTKIANLTNVAATYKTITPAPGTKALRDKLLKENKDHLKDPVVVSNIISELTKHDKDYYKDDPYADKILDRKGITARNKLFGMYGETMDFDESMSSNPILSNMSEGLDTDPEAFAKYMNDMRYASFSRGHSTQMAGYSYKILQRAISGLEIADNDCGTKIGFKRLIDKSIVSQLVNRYIRQGDQWKLVTDEKHAGEYLGKVVEMRSSVFCKSGNNSVCYRCMSESFKGNKTAMTNLASSMSAEFMTLFLKRMHTSGFEVTNFEVKDLIT